jgi:integrase
MRRLLTDRFCSTAKARDGDIQTDYFDAQVSGLALRVSQSGHRSWTFHYTLDKRRRLTFGNYPAISLSSARAHADEARAAVAQGHDPRLAAAETLRDICESYFLREGGKLRTVEWRKGALERHVYPRIGARPIAEIRRSEIVALLDRVEEKAGAAMATQVLAVVRKIFNWHATRSDDFISPIVRGMARTQRSEQARERVLSDDELRKIWTAGGLFGDYVRFLLLTAARRNEAAGMTWAEVTGSDWTLPGVRNKTGLDLVRPLSRAAMAILDKLPQAGAFVWSSNGGAKGIGGFSKYKSRLDRELGFNGWRIHDLRRTARSLMSRAGVPSDHAERCLGHVIGGVRGVYDRHEYHAEKRQAFEALAGQIERIINPQENVVGITKRGRPR